MDIFYGGQFVNIALLVALAAVALRLICFSNVRSADDVAFDILESESEQSDDSHHTESRAGKLPSGGTSAVFNDELAQAGLVLGAERRNYQQRAKLFPLLATAAVMTYRLVAWPGSPLGLILTATFSLAAFYLIGKFMLRKRQKRYQRSTEFYLPIVMERIVMSVQAGLDIFPAVRTALATGSPEVKSEDDVGNVAKYRDPVSRLLAMAVRLTERGLSFDESLNHVARMIDSSGMRHAFIHLGLAQREGGELIGPLRELSDSTQIYFQESVEEEIAGMPVKATMPLMLTFAGLISFCMASPIIQLLEFLQQAANQFK